jgi:hypothetical protein
MYTCHGRRKWNRIDQVRKKKKKKKNTQDKEADAPPK